MESDAQTSTSAMLRLLLDEDRLRIPGLLGCRPYPEKALATALSMKHCP